MRHRRQRGRHIDGILLLDKPTGITSSDAVQRIKRLYRANKVGHTGSLDPLASGLLVICLGEATKFSQYLLDAEKTYQVTAKLGAKTTTGDAEGEVVSEIPVPSIATADLEKVLDNFRGTIEQVPSMFSALKHNGQPLYKLARQGIEVERKSREVTIHDLQVTGFDGDELSLLVHCSKGTYIRTLVDDIGDALQCGAHVALLRRLGVGPYLAENMLTLEKLEEIHEDKGMAGLDECLLSMDSSVNAWPELVLSEAATYYLRMGQAVIVPHAPTEGWARLYAKSDKRFLGVGEILEDGRLAPRRLMKEQA